MKIIPAFAAPRLGPRHIGREREGARRTERGNRPLGIGRQLFTLGLNLAAPIALYYGLRAVGVGIYPALIVGAVPPALSTLVQIIRRDRLDGLGQYMMTMMLLSASVSLLTGSPRFLLAKDGWLTGVSGLWMLFSVRSRRPVTFLFARPLLEGRKVLDAAARRRNGPPGESWDSLWERAPRFRRIWRVSTVIWGVAMLVDAAIRVVMAYTLPVDLVPGLGGALWPVTFVVLQVITNLYFWRAGFWLLLRGELDPPPHSGDPA
ncbi:MAG TPA: VC0807 family protein [Chloroflexota bacterium]|nr:VC0807 family protein [Chloroflexota bacterium]